MLFSDEPTPNVSNATLEKPNNPAHVKVKVQSKNDPKKVAKDNSQPKIKVVVKQPSTGDLKPTQEVKSNKGPPHQVQQNVQSKPPTVSRTPQDVRCVTKIKKSDAKTLGMK